MKAISESRNAVAQRAGLILLFDGEVGLRATQASCLSRTESRDEHRQADILTSGLEPYSRLPGPTRDQWLWESEARYSGATVPDSHGVPGRLMVLEMDNQSTRFKEQLLSSSSTRSCQEKCFEGWWARQGSNLQGLLQRILSPSRLPIPPRAHCNIISKTVLF